MLDAAQGVGSDGDEKQVPPGPQHSHPIHLAYGSCPPANTEVTPLKPYCAQAGFISASEPSHISSEGLAI